MTKITTTDDRDHDLARWLRWWCVSREVSPPQLDSNHDQLRIDSESACNHNWGKGQLKAIKSCYQRQAASSTSKSTWSLVPQEGMAQDSEWHESFDYWPYRSGSHAGQKGSRSWAYWLKSKHRYLTRPRNVGPFSRNLFWPKSQRSLSQVNEVGGDHSDGAWVGWRPPPVHPVSNGLIRSRLPAIACTFCKSRNMFSLCMRHLQLRPPCWLRPLGRFCWQSL